MLNTPTYIRPYMGRPLTKVRHPQGAKLLALRRAAGLSQRELAEAIGETQRNIAYWETSAHPPRSAALPELARVLGVSVEELVFPGTPPKQKRGPTSKLERTMAALAALPKHKQTQVLEIIDALVRTYQ